MLSADSRHDLAKRLENLIFQNRAATMVNETGLFSLKTLAKPFAISCHSAVSGHEVFIR